jgi:hypothetical protein
MHGDERRSSRPRTGALHPLVYRINAALSLWMMLAAWASSEDAGAMAPGGTS